MLGLESVWFNLHDGFLEGIVRGHKGGLLKATDYQSLSQCENLEDIKMNLAGTDYSSYLQNEAGPMRTSVIVDRCMLKLVDDWKYMRAHADEPLAQFLDYCTYGHMIDNVVLIVTGTLHERDVNELLDKCHPLGVFDNMGTVAVASSMKELYRLVLVETPLAPYFSECLTSDDLDEMNIEVMRNTLYKAYLEDFNKFCQSMGGITAEIMGDLLAFEADKRAINVTLNSIGTELTRDDRKKLFCDFGLLYPHGHFSMAMAEDYDSVRAAVERVPQYRELFSQGSGFGGESQMLERVLFAEEVKRCTLTFDQQFHYGVFYAYLKLREQEIRNLMWVSECVAQGQRGRTQDGIVLTY